MPQDIRRLSTGTIIGYDDVTKKWIKYSGKEISLKSLSEQEIIEATALVHKKDGIRIQEPES